MRLSESTLFYREHSVPRNDLLKEGGNPDNHFVLGINLAPILTFGDVAHTILVRRDATAPNNPNRLNFCGGVSSENPEITGVKEINEELALLIIDSGKLYRARFNFEGRDGVDEKAWKAALPVIKSRLPPELKDLEIEDRKVNLTFDEKGGHPLQTVVVVDGNGNEASRMRGILNPDVRGSDFSMIIPVVPDWAGAGLHIRSPNQIICRDTETFVPHGREIGLFPISEIAAIPDDQKMPHVTRAGRVWSNFRQEEPGGAA